MQIDKEKLLEWLKVREEEAYENATQTLSPSFFKGKASAFADAIGYVETGYFDDPTIEGLKGELERLKFDAAWFEAHQKDCARSADYWQSHYMNLREEVERYRTALEQIANSVYNTPAREEARKALGNHS